MACLRCLTSESIEQRQESNWRTRQISRSIPGRLAPTPLSAHQEAARFWTDDYGPHRRYSAGSDGSAVRAGRRYGLGFGERHRSPTAHAKTKRTGRVGASGFPRPYSKHGNHCYGHRKSIESCVWTVATFTTLCPTGEHSVAGFPACSVDDEDCIQRSRGEQKPSTICNQVKARYGCNSWTARRYAHNAFGHYWRGRQAGVDVERSEALYRSARND